MPFLGAELQVPLVSKVRGLKDGSALGLLP